MRAYNVEFFTPDFSFIGNRLIGYHSNNEDYLSIDKNTITIESLSGVEVGAYIHIWCDDYNCQGIVTAVADKEKGMSQITYKPYTSILSEYVLFDTTKQGTCSLEQYIADLITALHISNADTEQNITGLSVNVTSNTTSWDLGLEPASDYTDYAVVKDFYKSVIVPALQSYGIVVIPEVDYQNQSIVFNIGTNTDTAVTIEADLENVISKSVTIKKTSNSKNKLTVYNSADFTEHVTYYLHSDLSYDTTNDDRLTPVVEEIKLGTASTSVTFAEKAASIAESTFGSIKYNNLIEIEIANDDSLINPNDLSIGQSVTVISDGVSYSTIYTGRERSKTTKLLFGTVRLSLTKILRGEI